MTASKMPPEALGPAARLTARGTPLPPFCSNRAVLDATAPRLSKGKARRLAQRMPLPAWGSGIGRELLPLAFEIFPQPGLFAGP